MSDQTRHSDTRPDFGIIIIQTSGDRERDALLLRIRDLVARSNDVLLAPPILADLGDSAQDAFRAAITAAYHLDR